MPASVHRTLADGMTIRWLIPVAVPGIFLGVYACVICHSLGSLTPLPAALPSLPREDR